MGHYASNRTAGDDMAGDDMAGDDMAGDDMAGDDKEGPMIDDATIEGVVARWHRHLRGELAGGLDELLADDVVFYSPIVYTPQRGKDVTKLYLAAALVTLPGEAGSGGGFRYTKEIIAGDTAVLEFETTVQGKYVNGVDIIRADDAGRIVEFRVMIRPLQAVNLVHEQMRARLEGVPAARSGL